MEQKEAQRKLKTQIILCCTAALFLAVAIRACSFNIEPDYFWHVKLGEWLIQNRQMMGADVFSWTAGEHIITEFAHSWLGSIILYVFHAVGTALFNYQYLGAFIYELLMFAILTGVLLYSVKDELPGLGRDIRNILLRGEPGTGKTEMYVGIAAGCHLPLYTFAANAMTEPFDMYGQFVPVDENGNQIGDKIPLTKVLSGFRLHRICRWTP